MDFFSFVEAVPDVVLEFESGKSLLFVATALAAIAVTAVAVAAGDVVVVVVVEAEVVCGLEARIAACALAVDQSTTPGVVVEVEAESEVDLSVVLPEVLVVEVAVVVEFFCVFEISDARREIIEVKSVSSVVVVSMDVVEEVEFEPVVELAAEVLVVGVATLSIMPDFADACARAWTISAFNAVGVVEAGVVVFGAGVTVVPLFAVGLLSEASETFVSV